MLDSWLEKLAYPGYGYSIGTGFSPNISQYNYLAYVAILEFGLKPYWRIVFCKWALAHFYWIMNEFRNNKWGVMNVNSECSMIDSLLEKLVYPGYGYSIGTG